MSERPFQLRADPKFLESIAGLVESVAHDDATVYGVWADLTLAYLGPRWFAFAAENAGARVAAEWGLGRSVAEAWCKPLDAFYRELFGRAIRGSTPISRDYECSSAQTHRTFRMTIYPIGDRAGALVVNSLLVEEPHPPPAPEAVGLPLSAYRGAGGLMVQCMQCRRTRFAGDSRRWDWVPALVDTMPEQISHGLCPICLQYYYPAPTP